METGKHSPSSETAYAYRHIKADELLYIKKVFKIRLISTQLTRLLKDLVLQLLPLPGDDDKKGNENQRRKQLRQYSLQQFTYINKTRVKKECN